MKTFIGIFNRFFSTKIGIYVIFQKYHTVTKTTFNMLFETFCWINFCIFLHIQIIQFQSYFLHTKQKFSLGWFSIWYSNCYQNSISRYSIQILLEKSSSFYFVVNLTKYFWGKNCCFLTGPLGTFTAIKKYEYHKLPNNTGAKLPNFKKNVAISN